MLSQSMRHTRYQGLIFDYQQVNPACRELAADKWDWAKLCTHLPVRIR
jgi:hypothetical protein